MQTIVLNWMLKLLKMEVKNRRLLIRKALLFLTKMPLLLRRNTFMFRKLTWLIWQLRSSFYWVSKSLFSNLRKFKPKLVKRIWMTPHRRSASRSANVSFKILFLQIIKKHSFICSGLLIAFSPMHPSRISSSLNKITKMRLCSISSASRPSSKTGLTLSSDILNTLCLNLSTWTPFMIKCAPWSTRSIHVTLSSRTKIRKYLRKRHWPLIF